MPLNKQAGVRSIVTPLRYADETKPPGVFYAQEQSASTCQFKVYDTEIVDARTVPGKFDLDTNGFELFKHQTQIPDFWDPSISQTWEASQQQHPAAVEVKELVQSVTGAKRVFIYQMLCRIEGGDKIGKRQPGPNVHIDFTADAFRAWARHTMGATEADRLMQGRWSALNIWRGTREVGRTPLALADGRSIKTGNMFYVPMGTTANGPMMFYGGGYNLTYDREQRWYYFSNLKPDEVLIFRLFDSDKNRVQNTAHTAFNDPSSDPNALPRSSFEARAFVFYDYA